MNSRVVVAGITGYTGRHLLPLLSQRECRFAVRSATATKSPWTADRRVVALDTLTDSATLKPLMQGADVAVCLVGTLRRYFDRGDTYDSVDIAIPRAMAEAAKGTSVKRLVLLSSLGAGSLPGAYLDAKREAEKAFITSGIAWVVLRPSQFMGASDDGDRSFERRFPRAIDPLFGLLARVPFLTGVVNDVRPIPVARLALALKTICDTPAYDNRVLSGRHLWQMTEPREQEPGLHVARD